MIGFFKERNTFQVPALLFITLVVKLAFINHPSLQTGALPGGLLVNELTHRVKPTLHPGFTAGLAALLILISAVYANYILTDRRMFSRTNMLTAVSIVLFTSLFPAANILSAPLLLLPALILLFQLITGLYAHQHPRPVIINIGLVAGCCYLLYHPFIWLLPCCFIGLAGMRPFRLAEWLLLLLGLLTPAYFLLSYEFFTDHWAPLRHIPNFHFVSKLPAMNIYWWLGMGMAALWILAGLAGWNQHTRRMLIQSRKNWYQLLFFGAFSIPMMLPMAGNDPQAIVLLAFPAGSMAANAFFSKERSIWQSLLFWLIIAMIATITWGSR